MRPPAAGPSDRADVRTVGAGAPRRVRLGLVWALLVCMLGLTLAPAVEAQQPPNYRFRSPSEQQLPAIDVGLLTDQERAYVAALPRVRVGVPLPPSAPYEVISPDGEVSGIHPDMLLALARTFGLRLEPVVLPDWSSTLEAAKRREVDIVMTLGVTTERMSYLAFTLGATPLPGALFARAGTQPELGSARFAIERSYMVNDWVRRQYPAAPILTVDTTADALRAVAEGRADVYLGSLLEATELLRRTPLPGIQIERMLSYGTGYYHFGVRKDWAPLAAILNKGIQTLRVRTSDDLAVALGGIPAGARPPGLIPTQGAGAALLAARPVWTVGAVRGLEPLNGVDERGMHAGIAAEYTEQVARRLGVGVQLRVFDSVAQMLDALEAGQIDLVPFLTRTPQREKSLLYSRPYVEMPYMVVARTDSPLYWNLDSLRGKRLALAARHPLRETLERQYPDIQIVDAPSGNGAMDLVERREADAAVEVKLFANLRINNDDLQQLRTVSEVAQIPAQFHFAVARGDAAMVALVDQALADIPPDEHGRMFRRWVATDLHPAFPWRRHAPLIAVVLSALLGVAGVTFWWGRRLRREVLRRRRTEGLLNDMAATVPGVAFRYLLNADGSIRHHFFTPGAKAFLGIDLDPQRTVLASLQPCMQPAAYAQALELQARCLRTGERFKLSFEYRSPGGRERWLHAEVVRNRCTPERSVWTGYLVDVSSERDLQARLAKEAESRNLMLASASHELRAPTHTLSLALQAMPRAGLDDEQQQALDTAQGASHMLGELLNDVLDAARSAHEPMRLRPRTFDLHQLLEDVGGAWRAAARTKGLGFVLSIAPGLPRTVSLDGLRLKQVLTNLLSNACKYTPAGQVTLHAEPAPEGGLRFVVGDTGIGIEGSEQARVFQPFVTLDDPGAGLPAEGSSGLGLATCRRIAELMGARIDLDSAPGRGTRVSFCVPLAAQGAAAPPDQGAIVVCDDDETSRLLTAHMLRREGFSIYETGDAAEALAIWRRGGVRALVSDLDLPGMGGLALIRQVRQESLAQGRRTSVIVCSGSPVPAEEDGGVGEACDAYLVKPFEVATLSETLKRLGVAQHA